MTAKQKAIELINKFSFYSDTLHNGNFANAKQCALIAADEILKIKSITMYPVLEDNMIYSHEEYWTKVKQEIEKL